MALTDDLEFYLKCDESSGDLIDAHASYDFTAFNTPTAGTGRISGSRVFSAASSEYASLSGFVISSLLSFTLSFWFKIPSGFNSGSDTIALASKYDDPVTAAEITVSYDPTNGIVFSVGAASVVVGATVSEETWHHVVVTNDLDDDEMRVVIDNGTPSVSAGAGANPGDNGTWYIASFGFSDYYNTEIDEYGFWSRALTPSEITDLVAPVGYPFAARTVGTITQLMPMAVSGRRYGSFAGRTSGNRRRRVLIAGRPSL